MPLLGQPDASIYGRTKLFSTLSGPGQLASGGGPSGPTAAQQRFGAEQQENAQIAQLAQQYGDDYDGLVKAVTQVSPERGLKMGAALEDYRKKGADTDIANSDRALKMFEVGSRGIQTAIEDPTTWPTIRSMLSAAGQGKFDPILPQPDDPNLQQKLVGLDTALQSQKDYLAQRKASMQDYLNGDKVKGALSLLAMSKQPAQYAASADIVKKGGLGDLLGVATDADTAQQMLDSKPKDTKDVNWQVKETVMNGKRAWVWVNPQTQEAKPAEGMGTPIAPQSSGGGGTGRPGGKSDVQEAVAGMKDGTVPPQLPGRASKDYSAIMAEAHRQKFDLAKASEDWVATQKYLGTLNGNQQTRLRQAVKQVEESVPLVRSLVMQWDSAGIPMLSSANLKAAMAGTYGNNAQSLARRLNAQIADMTSELGTVYKGGNSSTDESLKLAAQNLGADWSKKAALDALDQIEQNLQYRRNSMKLGPVTNGENRYAPDLSGGGPATSTPRFKILSVK